MSDATHIEAKYVKLDTDDSTILRTDRSRVQCAIYEGTTDADATTILRLTGLKDPVVVGVTVTLLSSTTGLWRIYDYKTSQTATAQFNVLWYDKDHASSPNSIGLSSVGSDSQGKKFRALIHYLEREP